MHGALAVDRSTIGYAEVTVLVNPESTQSGMNSNVISLSRRDATISVGAIFTHELFRVCEDVHKGSRANDTPF